MIEITDIHKSFNGKEVLKGINLKIARGETIVIIGSSGCGKSVLIKHIVGLLKPDIQHSYMRVGSALQIPVILVDPEGNPVVGKSLTYRIYKNSYYWWWGSRVSRSRNGARKRCRRSGHRKTLQHRWQFRHGRRTFCRRQSSSEKTEH